MIPVRLSWRVDVADLFNRERFLLTDMLPVVPGSKLRSPDVRYF